MNRPPKARATARPARLVTALLASIGCRAPEHPAATGGAAGGGGAATPDDGGGAVDARQPPAPFTIDALTKVGIGSEGSSGWATVRTASADVDWGAGPFAQVRLVVDLESACYPFEKWQADPPPTGQRWPADCDAFDRNLSVYLDDRTDPAATPGAARPGFEVIHAITPFGGPEHIEADLTDLGNGVRGPRRVRVDLSSNSDPQGLSTGSNAGWTVSARLEVTPGDAPRQVLAAIPLWAGRVGPGEPAPAATWEVPATTTAGRLEYRTSGHGQGARAPRCLGAAEEFCDRQHQIIVDGVLAKDVEAYRSDCQSLCTVAHYGPATGGLDYCQENPCGDMASVAAPRANWCPGSTTPPFAWQDIPALAVPGPHTVSFQIAGIAAGGFWLVSATYYAYGP